MEDGRHFSSMAPGPAKPAMPLRKMDRREREREGGREGGREKKKVHKIGHRERQSDKEER